MNPSVIFGTDRLLGDATGVGVGPHGSGACWGVGSQVWQSVTQKRRLDCASLPLRDTAAAGPQTLGLLVLMDVGPPAWQHD